MRERGACNLDQFLLPLFLALSLALARPCLLVRSLSLLPSAKMPEGDLDTRVVDSSSHKT